jgi:hypothetical protein
MTAQTAGALSERVALVGARARDAAGAAIPGSGGDPAVGAPVWASVEAVRVSPGVDAERLHAPARYRVVMRDAGMLPRVGDRLRWRGMSLSVLTLTRDPARPGVVEMVAELR